MFPVSSPTGRIQRDGSEKPYCINDSKKTKWKQSVDAQYQYPGDVTHTSILFLRVCTSSQGHCQERGTTSRIDSLSDCSTIKVSDCMGIASKCVRRWQFRVSFAWRGRRLSQLQFDLPHPWGSSCRSTKTV